MKGNFHISYDYLKELGACGEGLRAFKHGYPNGGEYQDILDKCTENGRTDFAAWLLNRVGATDDVRVYEEQVNNAELEIVFAGKIVFKFGAVLKRLITGWGIEAGEGIKAGWDFGIFAGLRVKLSSWSRHAKVVAKTKPENLISGFWDDSEAKDD